MCALHCSCSLLWLLSILGRDYFYHYPWDSELGKNAVTQRKRECVRERERERGKEGSRERERFKADGNGVNILIWSDSEYVRGSCFDFISKAMQ